MLGEGALAGTDWVWYEGLSEWVQILQIEDFSTALPSNYAVLTADADPPSEEPAATPDPTPAAAAPRAAVSASEIAERVRRLQKGNKSAAAKAAAKQPEAEAAPASTRIPVTQIVAVVLLMAVIAIAAFVVTSSLRKKQRPLPKEVVAKGTTLDVAKKLNELGAHMARDGNNEISGIHFPSLPISTNGWKLLSELKNLQRLSVANCGVTDADLANLKPLIHLKVLDLSDNPITNKGVEVLKKLPELTELNLSNTKITKDQVDAIKKALPKCEVMREAPAPPGAGGTKGAPP